MYYYILNSTVRIEWHFRYDTHQFGTCKYQYVAGNGVMETPRCLTSHPRSIGRRTSTQWHNLFVLCLKVCECIAIVFRKILERKWHLLSPLNWYHRPVVFNWVIWPPSGPHQFPNVPQENDGMRGPQNFSAWIKYFKFKIESKVPVSPASVAAKKEKVVFYCFFHILSGWIWFELGDIYLPIRLDMKRGDLRLSLTTATGHSKTCKCLSDPRNTLNILPVINRIFLLV
jgi:hypothetical protein